MQLLPHAEIVWCDGRIVSVAALSGPPPSDGLLWMPAFVDLHVHWPQSHVRGQFAGQLLPWLRDAIWPAEAAFADPAVAERRAQAFAAACTRAGTCAGLLFGPPFAQASLQWAAERVAGYMEGPALMERHGPPELLHPASQTLRSLTDAAAGRMFAITPRFAPNLTPAGLAACGALAAQTGWPVQSHLSENLDEVHWVRDLFPQAQDYLDVYDQAGLLGPRCILAHAIHVSDREVDRLAATGTWIAHCPTSNVALGSGRMPLERLQAAGVPWVLATDVGAGPQLSLLDVMRTFVQVHRGHAVATAEQSLCRATAAPGTFLTQFDPSWAGLGTLQPGAPAHLVALPCPTIEGDSPETLLRALLAQLPADAETAPTAVVQWGRRMFG